MDIKLDMKLKNPFLGQRFGPNSWVGLLFALFIGFVFVIRTFGFEFLEGVSSYWQTEADDVTQYIAGLNIYLKESWHYPLLAIEGLAHPVGTRVTFVDAIPALAFFLKLFGVGGGDKWINPFGYWVGLCYLLQAVAAWWVTRELEHKTWTSLLFLVVVFVTFPALMMRLGHISLLSHWIILAAFALYLRGFRMESLPIVGWCALFMLGFYINIYLFTMSVGIYLASIWGGGFFSRHPKDLLVLSAPFILLFVSFFIFLLPLPSSGVGHDLGFGIYSMNLLSPILGGYIFDVNAAVAPGQYEGMNYLGLGLIIAFILSLVLVRSSNVRVRQHLPLMILIGIYTIYALSDKVYFSKTLLFTVKYPEFLDFITSTFRASGRFFWVVGYGIGIFSIYFLYRRFSKKFLAALLVFFVLLQLFDLKIIYRRLVSAASRPYVQKMNYESFDAALGSNVSKVYFYPKFRCNRHPYHDTVLPFMRYSAVRNVKMNTGYLARYLEDCTKIKEEIAQSKPAESAYLFVNREFEDSTVKDFFSEKNKAKLKCQKVEWATICKIFD